MIIQKLEIKNRTVALSKVLRIQNLLCKSFIYLYLKISAVYIIYFENDKEMQKMDARYIYFTSSDKTQPGNNLFFYGDGGERKWITITHQILFQCSEGKSYDVNSQG